MPELPEVEAAKRYLEAEGLVGRCFAAADLRWPRAVRSGTAEDFVLGLTGACVCELGRRGKYIIVGLEQLDGRSWLVIHLGMTGSLPVIPAFGRRHKFAHNVLALNDGRQLQFVDPRKLGALWLVRDLSQVVGSLGLEPLDSAFDADMLEALFSDRSAAIKVLLMDQNLIAGVGNIYGDEALIRARVHPMRSGKSLTSSEFGLLHQGLVEALELAIAKLTDLHISGKPLGTRDETRQYFLVPREAGVQCRICTGVIERVVIRGRSAYFCSKCQKL